MRNAVSGRVSRLLALILLAASPALPGAAGACSPMFEEPVFWREFENGPERDALLGGEVGILDSTWSYPGLFVAWRHFEGLDPIPRQDWPDFQIGGYPVTGEASQDPPPPKGLDAWEAALSRVLGREAETWPRVDPEMSDGGHYFLNCLPPAFEAAAAALDQRLARWGASSRELPEWLRGQRKVFENCSKIGEAPPELHDSWPADLRADRQYQIAAADFYALRTNAAGDRFRRIAADNSSPWAKAAAFSAARCSLRLELYGQAAEEFRAIGADEDFAEYHPSAARLLRFAELRTIPEVMAERLEQELRGSRLPAEPVARLEDLDWLVGQVGTSPDRPLVYFLVNVTGDNKAFDVFAFWQKSPSPANLIAAMIRAAQPVDGPKLGKGEIEVLVAAAAQVPKSSPAYLSARYYRAALLSQVLGRPDEARAELDHLIAETARPAAGGDLGVVQRLRHDRAHLARDWNELIDYGFLTPVGEREIGSIEAYPLTGRYNPELEVESRVPIRLATSAINRFASLAELAQLQQNPALPTKDRREMALAFFLRAALQGKDEAAAGFADAAVTIEPGLAELFAEWKAARRAVDKKFAAVLLALRNPGLSIDLWPAWVRYSPREEFDDFRNNWWCTTSEWPAERPPFLKGKEPPPDAAFGWPAGPNKLGQEVLAYAKQHSRDPRLPEALHLAVRATRSGCNGESYLETSKAAFRMLHRRFPKNAWTALTPYYYE